jgi:predicted nucleotidyltransferase
VGLFFVKPFYNKTVFQLYLSEMNALIKRNIDSIKTLCKKHSVEAISLFGSATNETFSAKSDVDFIVKFSSDIEVLDFADNYFAFLDELEKLLKRKVDLISERALKNKILIQEISKTKIPLYESQSA